MRIPTLVAIGGAVLAACSSGSPSVTGPAPGTPTQILPASITVQSGATSQPVTALPSVKVTDKTGLPVSGVTVTFAVTAGNGSLSGATPVTNSTGVATVGSWTLGASAGTNTLTATVTGLTGSPVVFTANGGSGAATFNITLQYVRPAAAVYQSAFNAAVTRWETAIAAHTGDVNVGTLTVDTACGVPPNTVVTGTIHDLLIVVDLDSIDGPGKILGSASPCYLRNGGRNLTLLGVMTFDTADLAGLNSGGFLNDVILHEMNHVLGFGTLWEGGPPVQNSFVINTPAGTGSTLGFDGPKADSVYVADNGGPRDTVPVEDTSLAGTGRSHWKESIFQSELMTGFLTGHFHPLSLTSIESLADLGYTVNPAAADAFNLSTQPTLRLGEAPGPGVDLSNDVRRSPRFYVDEATGQVVRRSAGP
ncbi:MAG TPA: leishmanolysin-related zinc metalloendopeptidase [Gemmatimonadales bacterium]|nr:leishmanolysin-related zinc metalloendopeptidase [Gemmatimonadales bacterium]